VVKNEEAEEVYKAAWVETTTMELEKGQVMLCTPYMKQDDPNKDTQTVLGSLLNRCKRA